MPTTNWAPSAAKTFATCTDIGLLSGDTGNSFVCGKPTSGAEGANTAIFSFAGEYVADGGLNNHWYRNFSTDEPEYDAQLTKEMAGEERPVFGFFEDETDGKLVIGAEKMFAPVSKAFADAEAVIEEAAIAAEKAKTDAAAAALLAEGDDDTTDGATQFTAHATAVLAAVYALAF